MNISSLGASVLPTYGAGASAGASGSPPTQGAASSPTSGAASGGDSAEQWLANYLKETPAQRMENAWLAAHHLSEKALAALPPAQQDAIRKQMADDIKNELARKSKGANGTVANIVA